MFTSYKLSSYSQSRIFNNINLTLSFDGQDDPECSKFNVLKSVELDESYLHIL